MNCSCSAVTVATSGREDSFCPTPFRRIDAMNTILDLSSHGEATLLPRTEAGLNRTKREQTGLTKGNIFPASVSGLIASIQANQGW